MACCLEIMKRICAEDDRRRLGRMCHKSWPQFILQFTYAFVLLITNNNKHSKRKNKVLFIEAVNEIRNDKTMSYLDPHHIERIHNAYLDFKNEGCFSKLLIKMRF